MRIMCEHTGTNFDILDTNENLNGTEDEFIEDS